MVYPAHRPQQFLTVHERPSEYGSRPVIEPDTPERKAELDALEDLGDEIATLAAHIHAATYRFLALIAEFDSRRGWELGGHRTCAHWLSYRTKLDLGAAREKVRTARALTELPETSASMARGELSFSQVRALSRVATAENESELLELARGSTTAQLERAVRAWKRGDRQDEATRERERHARRCLSIFPDDDGMYVVRGKLTPEPAGSGGPASGQASRCGREPESQRAARQRRADALGLLAERAMAAGFGGADGKGAPVSGTRAERYQVMLHVDAETLDADAEPGRSELEDGTRVSAETSRRLACDTGLVCITHAPDGSVLDVGRRTRTIPPALRRALEVRDRGCRFPTTRLRRAVPAVSASPTAIMCVTGPTEARRVCRTASFCVRLIMRWSTRAAGRSTGGERGARSSSIRAGERTSRDDGARRCSTATPSTPTRSKRSSGTTDRVSPTGERPARGGSASRIFPTTCSFGPGRLWGSPAPGGP